MNQITIGMTWDRDGHTFTVQSISKNGKTCKVSEDWISEDTWKEVHKTYKYNISEDENGQFVWEDEYKDYAFKGDGYEWWARMYACGADNSSSFEEIVNNSLNKEEKAMAGAQVQVVDFEFNGVRYTNTRPNYYYKKQDGKQMRISKAEYDEAWEKSGNAEREAREAEQRAKDAEAEKAFNKKTKKASKPRKSKDIAYEGNGVTLTAKQVEFLKELPKSEIWDGYEAGVWCDMIADGIGWNPMSVGAMISTLREKGLVRVSVDRVNGKKCKGMNFTNLGLDVVNGLGLS
jgi:hypothetical protein